jgi:hypothetical protein
MSEAQKPSDSPTRGKREAAAPAESAEDSAEFPLLAFDNWRVNAIVPPLLFALAWLAVISPFGFLLKGFQVWMHEFGHATAAWLTGRKATPLPFGWTPVESDYSHFVYFGLLLLFGILFVAGWKERKVWPMIIAVGLAGAQYYLTWRMPEHRQEFWWGAFGGVGGEFYLSALMMVVFYVQLPEKFKWGGCRYVFFFLGAACFLQTYGFWRDVYLGQADIPYGSMISGEDDANGDMNKLVNDFGWTQSMIRRTFMALGNYCLLGLAVVYLAFLLRLNLVADWVVGLFSRSKTAGE